jgi:ABC-type Fe3+ transport system permease subunit
MSSKVGRVQVATVQAMESVITSYVAQGFAVVNKSEKSATLQKKKEFKIVWAVIGFLLCLLPLLIYLIVYATQPDIEVIEIVVVP